MIGLGSDKIGKVEFKMKTKNSLRPIWEEAKDQLVDCAFNPKWQLKGPLKHKKHDLGLNIE